MFLTDALETLSRSSRERAGRWGAFTTLGSFPGILDGLRALSRASQTFSRPNALKSVPDTLERVLDAVDSVLDALESVGDALDSVQDALDSVRAF